MTFDYSANCNVDACLTSMYWNWGPVYVDVVERSRNGTYVGGSEYFDADSGSMGLYGLMEGEPLQPGAAELPEADLTLIRETLAAMLAGDFTRFDVFKGPIVDN